MPVQADGELRAVRGNGKAAAPRLDEFELKVFHRGDFRKNEATLAAEAEGILGRPLAEGECGMIVSLNRKVVRLVFGVVDEGIVSDAAGRPLSEPLRVLPSRSHRILGGGSWHPLMLQNYAHKMGVSLKNRERLERFLKKEIRDLAETAKGN